MSLRTTALSLLVAASLVPVGAASASPSESADSAGSNSSTGSPAPTTAAPGFLVAAPGADLRIAAPSGVTGPHRLVRLRTSLLPTAAAGQAISFDVGEGAPAAAHFTRIDRSRDFTAWSGLLDSGLGAFTIVRSGSTYRASVTSPAGVYAVTPAAGDRYWLTTVAPYAGPESGDDTLAPAPRAGEAGLQPAVAAKGGKGGKRGKTRVDVLFAYTPSAKASAGGTKAAMKAAVGQAVADTNTALANSGIKVTVREKGIVRVKGTEAPSVFTDLRRLYRPHDGNFDSALVARTKHRADIVHLFTGGPSDQLCGAGYLPSLARFARPSLGASTSYVSCLPYIVATHELGHNLGADHIQYAGVSHNSKIPGAYGYYDVPHRFLTVMGYYDPCQDAGIYDCVRIPWFSSPTNTSFNGLPIGLPAANNTRVIKQIAPLVARYAR